MSGAGEAMHRTARQFAQAPDVLARAGAEQLVQTLTQQLTRDTGGDRRLRNLERTATEPRVEVSNGVATVTASGAVWAIVENGTKPHLIRADRSRRSQAVRVDGEWRTGPVRHSGSRGKHTFTIGAAAGAPRALDAQREEWEQIVRGH